MYLCELHCLCVCASNRECSWFLLSQIAITWNRNIVGAKYLRPWMNQVVGIKAAAAGLWKRCWTGFFPTSFEPSCMTNFTTGCQRKVIVPVKNDKAKSRLQHDFHKFVYHWICASDKTTRSRWENIGMSF